MTNAQISPNELSDKRALVTRGTAHVPQKFKGPGVNLNVNQDNRAAAFVVDPATQDALIEKRRKALAAIKEAEGQVTEGVKQTLWRASWSVEFSEKA